MELKAWVKIFVLFNIEFIILERPVEADYCNQTYTCTKQTYITRPGYSFSGRVVRESYTIYIYDLCKRPACCEGYTGSLCSQAICFGSTSCNNGGTCDRPNYCLCRPGFKSPDCREQCYWDKRWCWPGNCSDGFASNCKCISGFKRVGESITAQCQPTLTPAIDSCQIKAVGVKGTGEIWSFIGSPDCRLQRDFYGNLNISYFRVVLDAHFTVKIDNLTVRPEFVLSELFGVTDVDVVLHKLFLQGHKTEIVRKTLKSDESSQNPMENFSEENVTVENRASVQNGEMLCLTITVRGGGYLVSWNDENGKTTKHFAYDKTNTSREICYICDKTAPIHCISNGTCQQEPVAISQRITQSKTIQLTFEGWFDPYPPNGLASGVEQYAISIHEMVKANVVLKRDQNAVVGKSYVFNKNTTAVEIELPEKNPMLYAILLEVTDGAKNTMHARRFVFYDNASVIVLNKNKPFKVTSATTKTWQTDHDQLCFDWTGRFYNNFYHDYNPLLPIDPDNYDEISGFYDQIHGPLSIYGTTNINGITEFYYSLTRNRNNIVLQGHIRNISESICLLNNMNDGDVFTLNIQAQDIVNHTLNDSVTVNIDRSVPEIIDVWLVRENTEQLYVHHSAELSLMKLQFKAFDKHSGLKEVKLALSVNENNKSVLMEKALPVVISEQSDFCINRTDCYCPLIGNCSLRTFESDLSKLRHTGRHNKRYLFTVKVTNNAQLVALEHIDILVDESPPDVGIVVEGPVGSPDIDYTSSDDVMVHWNGFIDHESGIKIYRVGLAKRCMSKIEMTTDKYNKSVIQETSHESIHFAFSNGDGHYYVSIVAFNNAMSPSDVVCSDGVTLDKSLPNINDVSLKYAKTREVLACYNRQPWLITQNVSKVKLIGEGCMTVCYNETDNELVRLLPERVENKTGGTEISSFVCTTTNRYQNNLIYTPSDLFEISWSIDEDDSQIANVYVGFGGDLSSLDAPDILDYVDVHNQTKYVQRHPGMVGWRKIYIFIKVKNRSGLEKKVWYGPILADESPPICSSDIQPFIKDRYLIINWTNTVLYDTEQAEEIGNVIFRVGTNNRFITPYLEWSIYNHGGKCGANHQCIKYPVRRLQMYNSAIGSMFFVQLHVYNYAGHFCSVNTKSVLLPSVFPPRDGVVIDLFPDSIAPYHDTDVVFNSSMYCFAWNGFNHHEDVELQAGLGTKPNTDNVNSFHVIPNAMEAICEKLNRHIIDNQKYFVTLKASCSVGTTYASSDGFTLVKSEHITSSLNVLIGSKCDVTNQIMITKIKKIQEGNITVLYFLESLIPGKIYSLLNLKSEDNLKIKNNSIHIIGYSVIHNTTLVSFTPLDAIRQITIFSADTENNQTGKNISLHKCDAFTLFQSSKTLIPVYWSVSDRYALLVTHYEAALCQLLVSKEECHSNLIFNNVGNKTETHFRGSFVDGFYKAAVKACFGNRCLQPAWSNIIDIRKTSSKYPNVKSTGVVDHSCLNTSIAFDNFACTSKNNIIYAVGYRWAIFSDATGRSMMSKWNVVYDAFQSKNKQDTACLKLPVYPHKNLYVCLEFICLNEFVGKTCSVLEIESDPNTFDKDVVYDLNLKNPLLKDINKYEHSGNIGYSLAFVHDLELDFADYDDEIGGFLLKQSEGIIQWFLLKEHILQNGPCSLENACLMTKNTSSGFVKFDNAHITENGIFYICAEILTTNSQEIKRLCSNGFLVDNIIPQSGIVTIDSNRGYIVDVYEMTLHWSGFRGNPKTKDLGYPSEFSFYEYAIGTHPGSDDIVRFSYAGLAQSKTIEGLNLKPGQAYYATVKAYNHKNYTADAYSEPVIFDCTPPTIGTIYVQDYLKGFVKSHNLRIEWSDIEDNESGVQKFEIGMGSSNNSANIIPFQEAVDYFETSRDHFLQDGHQYFAILKATNGAGLESYSISSPFVVDGSPPEIGHVMDVLLTGSDTEYEDIDYQTKSNTITCLWYGFHDTHSDIISYKVALGTLPGDDDVMLFTYVGLTQFQTWTASFVQVVKYYSTVEACNGAGLCSRATSNGIIIDNSTPTPGIVVVGDAGRHSKYLPDSKTLHSAWTGFQDPQSGIDHFEVCVGTSKQICNIMNWWNVALSSTFMRSNINMTVGVLMYVTVRACNKVAMCTQGSSPGFMIDDTAPLLKSKPRVVSLYSDNYISGQIMSDPSFFKVVWRYKDDQSPITRTIVSMHSNLNSHVPLPDIVLTNQNEFVAHLTKGNILRQGDTYKVKVTACNAASLCTTAESEEILVDYTPPQIGGFMSPLQYEWCNDSARLILNVSWYGFVDTESDIKLYYMSVGSTYSGVEYLDNLKMNANTSKNNNSHEAQIALDVPPRFTTNLFLTLLAENYAGIFAKEVKVTTTGFPTIYNGSKGRLYIQKHSCMPNYCNNDCTCAARGKKCTTEENVICHNITSSEIISVNVTLITSKDSRDVAGSSKCLRSKWAVYTEKSTVLRMEYSFGMNKFEPGKGVYNLSIEDPWHDVGKRTHALYCLPDGHELEHKTSYVAYVRAWLSFTEFAIFSSPPIVVDHTAPEIKRNHFVVDANQCCEEDVDYILPNDIIGVCWKDVFFDDESGIAKFQIFLGTSPSMDDTVSVVDVGQNTFFKWTGYTFESGIRYFATVRATNSIGFQIEISSDGFMIDNTPPIAGIVYNNGHQQRDVTHQSPVSPIIFSWHGFDDEHSFIDFYLVAFLVNDFSTNSYENVSFANNGLSTNVTYKGRTQHNDTIVALVKARDRAGHESIVVSSPPLLIDATPPKSFNCDTFLETQRHDILVKGNDYSWSLDYACDRHDLFNLQIKIDRVHLDLRAHLTIDDVSIILPFAVNADGSLVSEYAYLSVREGFQNISVNFYGVTRNATISIKILKCLHLSIKNITGTDIMIQQISSNYLSICVKTIDIESGVKQILVGAGSVYDGLEIRELRSTSTSLHDVIHGNFTHGMVIYVKAVIENHAGLKSILRAKHVSIDHTPPVIQNPQSSVRYQYSQKKNTVTVTSSWETIDNESGVKYCEYCLGFTNTSCGLIPWTIIPNLSSYKSTDLLIDHGSTIFGIVRCINNVELVGLVNIDPLIISYLPPSHFNSKLEFITNIGISSIEQVDTEYIAVRWNEFEDMSIVQMYNAQVLHKQSNVMNWTNIGKKNYFGITGLNMLNEEIYEVNVKAINAGNIASLPINASIKIHNNNPKLSGSTITIQRISITDYVIKWATVFLSIDIIQFYDVSVGSVEGSTDILMPSSTTTDNVIIYVMEGINNIYVVVTAVTSTGITQTWKERIVLP